MNGIAQSVENVWSIPILDNGQVQLRSWMGSDLSVVASARVSNGDIVGASKGEEADAKLISYLIKHKHGTPFEHNAFTFYVKTPLFVTREWMRHRIGSFNEISGRYVVLEPEFYIPSEFRVSAASNKQGSVFPSEDYKFTIFEDGIEHPRSDWNRINREDVSHVSNYAYEMYQELLNRGVAREMARMILPLNTYTQFYWTVNARALMNFLSLRMAEDAQWEIRQYANAISELFKKAMPMTWNAWVKNERIAP